MVAAKLRMREGLSLHDAVDRINRLEVHLREQVPDVGWLFMEPDRFD